MSIQALPESTTRRLGAGQALPSPVTLVKELLDNAIDARATSIEVLLSANTLDKIEVRDNGTGIRSDDLEQVGKRGHTSKLTCFEEVRTVGRRSLGFRGEALASACSMGEVAIITRTEGSVVATAAKLKPAGGTESTSNKSHPVGTTICVSNLFFRYPVRKQNFLKQASKSISDTKDLLQSYALARLHIRISLKVLKTSKSNWSYVSWPQDGLKEGAAKVVGKDVAALCVEEVQNFKEPNGSNLTIQVLLPKADSDFSKIKGACYASIDRRPLSCARETIARKIYTGYKAALRDFASKTGQTLCKDPFLCISITSQNESYDPNVEPAKDDVLFASADSLVRFMDEFFRSKYPPPPAPPVEDPRTTLVHNSRASILSQDYDALLEQQLEEAQKRVTQNPLGPGDNQDEQSNYQHNDHQLHERSKTPFMPPPALPQVAKDLGSALNPWTISNKSAATPYPAALMQPPFPLTSDTSLRQQRQHNKPATGPFQTPPASHARLNNQILPNAPYKPSPLSAPPSKPPPGQKTIEAWLTHSDDESHFEDYQRPPTRASAVFDDEAPFGHSQSRPRRQSSYCTEPEILDVESPPRKQQKLGPAFVKAGPLGMGMNMTPPPSSQTGSSTAANAFSCPSPGVQHSHPSSGDELPMMSMDDEPPILGHPRHLHQAQLGHRSEDGDYPLSQANRGCSNYRGGAGGGRSRDSHTNKPFQSHRRMWISKSNTGSQRHPSPGPDHPLMSLDDDEPAQASPLPADDPIGHSSVEHAMDFEHRKIAATKRLRDENALKELDPNHTMRGENQAVDFEKMMPGRLGDITRDSQVVPHGEAASTVERSATAFTNATSKLGTTMPHDDPRAYLMKRQRTMNRTGNKVTKMKSSRLPLEAIPAKEEMHGLALTVGIRDVNFLNQEMLKLGAWDSYVYGGRQIDRLDMTEEETVEAEEKMKRLMEAFKFHTQGTKD